MRTRGFLPRCLVFRCPSALIFSRIGRAKDRVFPVPVRAYFEMR
jgi:hypothetical protein